MLIPGRGIVDSKNSKCSVSQPSQNFCGTSQRKTLPSCSMHEEDNNNPSLSMIPFSVTELTCTGGGISSARRFVKERSCRADDVLIPLNKLILCDIQIVCPGRDLVNVWDRSRTDMTEIVELSEMPKIELDLHPRDQKINWKGSVFDKTSWPLLRS